MHDPRSGSVRDYLSAEHHVRLWVGPTVVSSAWSLLWGGLAWGLEATWPVIVAAVGSLGVWGTVYLDRLLDRIR